MKKLRRKLELNPYQNWTKNNKYVLNRSAINPASVKG